MGLGEKKKSGVSWTHNYLPLVLFSITRCRFCFSSHTERTLSLALLQRKPPAKTHAVAVSISKPRIAGCWCSAFHYLIDVAARSSVSCAFKTQTAPPHSRYLAAEQGQVATVKTLNQFREKWEAHITSPWAETVKDRGRTSLPIVLHGPWLYFWEGLCSMATSKVDILYDLFGGCPKCLVKVYGPEDGLKSMV